MSSSALEIVRQLIDDTTWASLARKDGTEPERVGALIEALRSSLIHRGGEEPGEFTKDAKLATNCHLTSTLLVAAANDLWSEVNARVVRQEWTQMHCLPAFGSTTNGRFCLVHADDLYNATLASCSGFELLVPVADAQAYWQTRSAGYRAHLTERRRLYEEERRRGSTSGLRDELARYIADSREGGADEFWTGPLRVPLEYGATTPVTVDDIARALAPAAVVDNHDSSEMFRGFSSFVTAIYLLRTEALTRAAERAQKFPSHVEHEFGTRTLPRGPHEATDFCVRFVELRAARRYADESASETAIHPVLRSQSRGSAASVLLWSTPLTSLGSLQPEPSEHTMPASVFSELRSIVPSPPSAVLTPTGDFASIAFEGFDVNLSSDDPMQVLAQHFVGTLEHALDSSRTSFGFTCDLRASISASPGSRVTVIAEVFGTLKAFELDYADDSPSIPEAAGGGSSESDADHEPDAASSGTSFEHDRVIDLLLSWFAMDRRLPQTQAPMQPAPRAPIVSIAVTAQRRTSSETVAVSVNTLDVRAVAFEKRPPSDPADATPSDREDSPPPATGDDTGDA